MKAKTKPTSEQIQDLRAQAAELLERADQRAASIMELAEGKAALLRERGDAVCGKIKQDAMDSCIHWLKCADSADQSAVTFSEKAQASKYRDMAQRCEDRGSSGASAAREGWYLKAERLVKRAALEAKARTDSLRQRAARLHAQADRIEQSPEHTQRFVRALDAARQALKSRQDDLQLATEHVASIISQGPDDPLFKRCQEIVKSRERRLQEAADYVAKLEKVVQEGAQ